MAKLTKAQKFQAEFDARIAEIAIAGVLFDIAKILGECSLCFYDALEIVFKADPQGTGDYNHLDTLPARYIGAFHLQPRHISSKPEGARWVTSLTGPRAMGTAYATIGAATFATASRLGAK